MLVKNYTFPRVLKLILIFFLFFVISNKVLAKTSIDNTIKQKEQEVKNAEKKLVLIDEFIYNLKKADKFDKILLKNYSDYITTMILASDDKDELKNVSKKIYNNTLCLARKMGESGLVYVGIINGKLIDTDKKKYDFQKAQKYLETLKTPNYTKKQIKKMCHLK